MIILRIDPSFAFYVLHRHNNQQFVDNILGVGGVREAEEREENLLPGEVIHKFRDAYGFGWLVCTHDVLP
jgi:hypothetical protein